jgi:hypothetical protein
MKKTAQMKAMKSCTLETYLDGDLLSGIPTMSMTFLFIGWTNVKGKLSK